MARRKKSTSLQSKISVQSRLDAFFTPIDVDIKKENPFSKNPTVKTPSDGKIDIPSGIIKGETKHTKFGSKKQNKQLTSKQLGITKEQLDVIKQANNRLRKLEKSAFARASPAAKSVINRLSQIYGDNKPDEVSFYLDNTMNKVQKSQIISEARKFIKMSTSTVEGTQKAMDYRDRRLAETWNFLEKDDEGNYITDEEGNYVIDESRLSTYQDIAELYSSDIINYNLGSKEMYEVISNTVNRGLDPDIIKITLEIALDKSYNEGYEQIEKGEITSRLNSELDFVSKALDYLDYQEDYDKLSEDFRYSISELRYGTLDNALQQIDYFRSHLNSRREAVDEKKRGNFKFKW